MFLFGDKPHVADCSMYGFLVLAKSNHNVNPMTTAVRENERLTAFVTRMTRLLGK
jgi:hypothetical protein